MSRPPDVSAHSLNRNLRHAADLLKADLHRRLTLEGEAISWWNACRLLLRPGTFAVAAYRLTTWLHANGWTTASKIVDGIQYRFTHIECETGSDIAGGLVIADARGIVLCKHMTVGRNLTIIGASTVALTGEGHADDRVVLGEHCVLGAGTKIIGAVTLAAETQVKTNSVVIASQMTVGGVLNGVPARRESTTPRGSVAAWNPLRGSHIAVPAAGSAVSLP